MFGFNRKRRIRKNFKDKTDFNLVKVKLNVMFNGILKLIFF